MTDAVPQLRESQAFDHVLFDGSFCCSEAQELLLTLLETQAQHHKLQTLRSLVQSECSHEPAKRSLQQLESARTDLCKQLAEVAPEGGSVRVRATVELVFDPPRRAG